jgi:hypothetical protein
MPTFSVDVTVRAIVEANTQNDAEDLVAETLLNTRYVEEYYNLQSREGSHSALYVGDETDQYVWRPSETTNA